MYEDTPQELVHDLISEAVFGTHPLGRPVIGTAEVISSRHAARDLRPTTGSMYVPGNVVVAAAGNIEHDELRRARCSGARARGERPPRGKAPQVRPPLVKPPPPEPALPAQGHRAVPRLRRRARDRALRPAPLRRLAARRRSSAARPRRGSSRRSARSAGMAYAVYSFASQYTDTGQIGIYVGTREDNLAALPRDRERADRRHRRRATCAPSELERAKENLKGRILLSMESTSNRMSRLGKSLITDTELLSIERIMAEIDAVEPDALAELAGDAARAGEAVGRRDRTDGGALPARRSST